MRGENQRRNWRPAYREMGKTRTPAPIMVEMVVEDGKVTQHRTKDEVEHAIHNEISPRFSRAGSVPICNGPLFELLGYTADTEAGNKILEGTFKPPQGTDHQHHCHQRRLPVLLEKGQRMHSIVLRMTPFWSIRCSSPLGHPLRDARPALGPHHQDSGDAKQVVNGFISHARENCRSSSGHKTARNPSNGNRFQLPQ